MRTKTLPLLLFATLLFATTAAQAQGLFISQYVDTGSGTTPKGIEIVNNTGSAVDFSSTPLVVNRYANDNTSPTREANITTGTLDDGDVIVIGGSDLQSYMQREHPSVYFVNEGFLHNGDDALEILLDGTRQDLFGEIGPDTGPWSGDGVSSEDQNIAVNDDIVEGNPNGFTDPSTRFSTVAENPTSDSNEDLMGFGEAPALNGDGGGGGDNPTVQFTASSATVNEGDDAITIAVSLANPDGISTNVDVVFDDAESSANSSDISGYQTQTLTFGGSSADTLTVTVTITDDSEAESPETATFYLANASGASIGSPDAYNLTIEDNEIPDPIDIAEARDRANGTLVTVEGVTTRAEGDFTRIQDATGGLTIRQTAGATDPAFKDSVTSGTIRPGTEVRVTGRTSEFNYLKQINSDETVDDLRSFEILSQGNELPAPQTVTLQEIKQNGEEYESELLRVENLTLETPDEQYQAAQEYTNLSDATLSDGSVSLYIPNATDTEVEGTTVLNEFTFVGVLGQYNFVNDPDVGYQLLPVAMGDVRVTGDGGTTRLRFNAAGGYRAESRDSANVSVVVANPSTEQASSVTIEHAGGTATAGEDFAAFETQTLTFSAGQNALSVSLALFDDDRSEGDETIVLELSNPQGGNEAALGTPSTFTLTIVDDEEYSILADQDGASLRETLADTYEPTTLGYDVARDRLFGDLFNRQDTVRGFYTGAQVYVDPSEDPSTDAFEKGYNTEHAWPRSMGAEQEPARSNLYILFPTRESVNSARSNLPYSEIPDEDTETWYYLDQTQQSIPSTDIDSFSESTSDRFEPRETVKGDVARAVFYFNAIYPDRADASFFDQQKAVLRDWHQQDPASTPEKRRNAQIAGYQDGNINPFITDSTLVRRAFFTTVSIDDEARPAAFTLHGNAPNPVEASTTLHFDLPAAAQVSVSVYDALGRQVLAEPARTLRAGSNRTLTITQTEDLPAGLYIYRLTARTDSRTLVGSGAMTIVQ